MEPLSDCPPFSKGLAEALSRQGVPSSFLSVGSHLFSQCLSRLRWRRAHPDAVRTAGEASFIRIAGQDFAIYDDCCTNIAKAVINGGRPSLAFCSSTGRTPSSQHVHG